MVQLVHSPHSRRSKLCGATLQQLRSQTYEVCFSKHSQIVSGCYQTQKLESVCAHLI